MTFTYNRITKKENQYLEIVAASIPLETEQQTVTLMGLCAENGTNLLMLHGSVISESFYRFATGVAGDILQKLINYHIKTAFVLTKDTAIPKRFQEMMLEANTGSQYRFFDSRDEAEQWLLPDQDES